ncbi:autophagy-related protein 9A [Diabrotica undecimpunctata]|uniref:autophagy-related protein 9A n=1 Tax=Diabrotica undecimpunctata TaxID=50387 RepID=UPI003B638CD7
MTMQNYSTLQDTAHDQDEQGIVFHVAEPTRSKWNHIEDLDSFFTRMYKYHQRHGFMCIMLEELSGLGKFIFVVILTVYLFHGINYSVLFGWEEVRNHTKVTLDEIIYPVGQTVGNFSYFTWFLVIIAIAFLLFMLVLRFYQTFHFWDIKQFYNTALKVNDDELDNLTWCDIIAKIKDVQIEQQMCIHKRELTELDIYHRILRQENYMVAMVNKHLLPPRLNIPFVGEVVFWTKTLRYNVQGLLFRTPFESPWQLREEYKKYHMRQKLADELQVHIRWLFLINLMLAPVVFLWLVLYTFYSYGELIKREPGRMGMRNWSLYSKLYFRHFNELDHELHARLTRSYRPASKYLEAFSSPITSIIARYVGFICGSLFIVLIALALYDEDVLAVEHVLSVMTGLGGITAICRSLIPDETIVWCPEQLLECVVAHTHYLPSDWKGQAHTSRVRKSFQELFQMSVVAIFENLISPIMTPLILMTWMYPRSLEFVDFFRNFTVSVVGVGDVCSFAEMDVKKHGNPLWQVDPHYYPSSASADADQYLQGEDGKVELSLIHFTTTNPAWIPPPDAQDFIDSVQEEAGPNLFDSDLELYPTQVHFDEQLPRKSVMRTRSLFRGDREVPSTTDVAYQQTASQDIKNRPEKSVVWFDSETSAAPSLRKSVTWLEGPDLAASLNMRKSAIALHSRRTRNIRSYEETTPLLSTTRRPSR